MKQSATIIGTNQYEHAKTLLANAKEEITGPVDFRHSFLDMPNIKVSVPAADGSSESVNLCVAALGYSFAGGTTDGPGMLNFTQGVTTGNPFWDKVADFLGHPTEEEKVCHHPKPILFNTGDMLKPYAWEPATLPIQLLRVGNLFIAVPAAEFTTMSGRRLRQHLYTQIRDSKVVPDDQEIYITIAGLSNSYSHYVTTYEEYQAQRYEAASTLYGPHTLEGYLQEFGRIAG
jgi:neutral ceramidase